MYVWFMMAGDETLCRVEGQVLIFSTQETLHTIQMYDYPFTHLALTEAEFASLTRVATSEDVGIHYRQNEGD